MTPILDKDSIKILT
jgi:hypothetical protein